MSRASSIILTAQKYIGIIEMPGNTGWLDQAFLKLMKLAGWYLKAPWCMFFCKMVYKQVYADKPEILKVINNCFTGGAMDTLIRVHHDGTFKTGTEPKNGAIAIYKKGDGPSGHAAIVETYNIKDNVETNIEGNTNASGSREGDRVARKLRTISRAYKSDGLNLVGYIYPLEA